MENILFVRSTNSSLFVHVVNSPLFPEQQKRYEAGFTCEWNFNPAWVYKKIFVIKKRSKLMKRFLILPLTFLMLISTFIGCTNFGDNSDSDTENNSSNTNNDYNPPSSDTGGNTGGGGNDEPYNPPTYSYTVIHYKSDTYETEEETFYVTAGTTVTIVPKQYEFYHPDPDNTAQIEIDYDYRTVYLYYDRNEVKLTLDYNDGVSEIYEDTFYAGWEVYLNRYNPGERENLIFKGWEPPLPDIVPNEDTTYTAQWSYHTITPSIDIKLPTDTIELFREDEVFSWGETVYIKFRHSYGYGGYYDENALSWEVNGIDLTPLAGKGAGSDFEWEIYQTTGREYKYSLSFLTPNEPANPDLCNIRGEVYSTYYSVSRLGDDEDSPDDDYLMYPYHLGINDIYVTINSGSYPLSYHFQILIEE